MFTNPGITKIHLHPNCNEQQIALFENDKLAEVVVENTRHIKAPDVKQTVVRVNHPGRNPLPAHLRREEIILTPAEDVTGLKAVGQEVTEMLEYQQGELYVKKYIRPEYIKSTAEWPKETLKITRAICKQMGMPLIINLMT